MIRKKKKEFLEDFYFVKQHVSLNCIHLKKEEWKKCQDYFFTTHIPHQKGDSFEPFMDLEKMIRTFHVEHILGLGALPKHMSILENDYPYFTVIDDLKSKTFLEKLRKIPTHSKQFVFAFETIYTLENREDIYQEVFRILKKGGYFLVADFFLVKDKKEFSEIEELARQVITKVRGEEFIFLEDIKSTIRNVSFKLFLQKNQRNACMSALQRNHYFCKQWMRHRILFRFTTFFVPKWRKRIYLYWYLLSSFFQMNLMSYYFLIFQKEKEKISFSFFNDLSI